MIKIASRKSFSTYCAEHVTPLEVAFMQKLFILRSFSGLTRFFRGISQLGNGSLWWISGLILLGIGSVQTRWAVLAAAIAVGLSVSLFMVLKKLISRPRPCDVWLDIPCLMAPPDRFSFPSGHTMTAFAVYAAYAEMLPGSAAIFLPVAILMGLSRVVLGLHYPTDVLVGALLGTAIGRTIATAVLAMLAV